ncbi:hypothetical protein [Sphaerisporangium rubeum]|uniref:Uncharacterized protein n=1 Tax=Sphaerisporangium rubeum TaxID=321317 RepID=A0A7X0M8Y0_9ACTN|nr:hypothetical protein [Sphaerisporangium rubeum]MBB6476328.1 hypothetical protein [Sphaerisporangium rubeum]
MRRMTEGTMQETARAVETARTFLPPPERMLYYGALGALAVFGLVEWPVAAAIGAGTMLAQRARREGMERREQGMGTAERAAKSPARAATSRPARATTSRSTGTTGTTRARSAGTTRSTGTTRARSTGTTRARSTGTRAGAGASRTAANKTSGATGTTGTSGMTGT